jgi:hypothetical protein
MKASNKSAQSAPVNNNAKASAKPVNKVKDLTAEQKALKELNNVSTNCSNIWTTEIRSLKKCIEVINKHQAFDAKRKQLKVLHFDFGAVTCETFATFVGSDFVHKGVILRKKFPSDYTDETKDAVINEYSRNSWTPRSVLAIIDKYIRSQVKK